MFNTHLKVFFSQKFLMVKKNFLDVSGLIKQRKLYHHDKLLILTNYNFYGLQGKKVVYFFIFVLSFISFLLPALFVVKVNKHMFLSNILILYIGVNKFFDLYI